MKTELDILKDVVEKFDKAGINYMLTGSMAMSFYAQPRMTRDIDLIIELFPQSTNKLEEIFKDEYYISVDAIDDAIQKEFAFNLIHYESSVKVDCIIRKNDDYRLNEFSRRKKIKFHNCDLFIVGIEDLIISKLIWAKDSHSETQLNDVRNLLKEKLDIEYVSKWVKKLGIKDLFEKVSNE